MEAERVAGMAFVGEVTCADAVKRESGVDAQRLIPESG